MVIVNPEYVTCNELNISQNVTARVQMLYGFHLYLISCVWMRMKGKSMPILCIKNSGFTVLLILYDMTYQISFKLCADNSFFPSHDSSCLCRIWTRQYLALAWWELYWTAWITVYLTYSIFYRDKTTTPRSHNEEKLLQHQKVARVLLFYSSTISWS